MNFSAHSLNAVIVEVQHVSEEGCKCSTDDAMIKCICMLFQDSNACSSSYQKEVAPLAMVLLGNSQQLAGFGARKDISGVAKLGMGDDACLPGGQTRRVCFRTTRVCFRPTNCVLERPGGQTRRVCFRTTGACVLGRPTVF